MPCDKKLCDPRFKSLFHLVSWQTRTENEDGVNITQQLEYLLTLLAPSIRIEPGLLRQMRRTVQASSECSIAGSFAMALESLLWQHPAIQERHSVAASWTTPMRKHYLDAFEQLSPNEQTLALKVIRAWRGESLSHQVWFEELSSLSPATQQLSCIRQDAAEAAAYFQQLSNQSQLNNGQDIPQARAAWFKRLEGRLPEHSLEQSLDLQRISYFVHQGELHGQAKNIDPRNLPPTQEAEKQAVLIQQGERLYLLPYITKDGAIVTPIKGFTTPLALIRLAGKQLQLRVNDKNYAALVYGDNKAVQLPTEGELSIISDREVLHLSQLSIESSPPIQITRNIARDQYGLYTDVSINGIIQHFRYIEPGCFLMGSAEDEPEREPWGAKETQHQVILTEGFWLADTTVTQALYQAVMGENPSHFNDDVDNPVEQVSWDDAQRFIEKLNMLHPELKAQLPTEAQWEYACRAGTLTPFSFGENISTEQVNYDGNYAYAGGEKGENRKKTVVVKSLPANPWGLYAMHGNVWEWCVDQYRENLGDSVMVDPIEIGGGSSRVLRGGSWISYGGDCRSAMRYDGSAGYRGGSSGFRFSLGHKFQ